MSTCSDAEIAAQIPGTALRANRFPGFTVLTFAAQAIAHHVNLGEGLMKLPVIERVINLLDENDNTFLNTTYEQAEVCVREGDVDGVRAIDGQFAILAKNQHIVRMARSIGRPMRYFLAKQKAGPCLSLIHI